MLSTFCSRFVPARARPSGRFRPWTCRQDSLRALPPTESAVCSDMRGWRAFKWQNSSSGNAGPEWVLCGGEMLQEEMTGFNSKDKDIKHKTLMLAALRVAALDAGHCADMPETDFAAIGGAKKERLPPGLMSNTR
jgi:hypothetical protein